MRTWRTKLIFFLIVYFAGFATAIYCLTPVTQNRDAKLSERGFAYSALKSDEFAKSFNSGMHKCADFGKDVSWRLGRFIKQKLDERKTDS